MTINFTADEKKALVEKFHQKLDAMSSPKGHDFGYSCNVDEIHRMRDLLEASGITLGAEELDLIRRIEIIGSILNPPDKVADDKIKESIETISRFLTFLKEDKDLLGTLKAIGYELFH